MIKPKILSLNRRYLWFGLAAAIALAATQSARAMIPEPDAVIYGKVYHRFDRALIPSYSSQISIIALVNGVPIATNAVPYATNTFLVRIPMDDGLDPRQPGTAKAGDEIHLIIRNNLTSTQFECVQTRTQSWTLATGRAPAVLMNLSIEESLVGTPTDANHDGILDFWYDHYKLTITSPKAGSYYTNDFYTIKGTARGQLSGVWYQLNGGDWTLATTANGYSNWMAGVTLPLGTNTLRAYTADMAGYCSPTNTTIFYRVPPLPFVPLKGVYSGLFYETNGVTHETSGFFTFTLSSKGSFSGKLYIGGGTYGLYGTFPLSGLAHVVVPRSGKTALTVDLKLDLLSNVTQQVQGTVKDPTWTAPLLGDLAVFNAISNPAPQMGTYTMIVEGAADSISSPSGDGIATVTVDASGLVTLTGTLADNRAISQKVRISKDGNWPLYVPLYSGKGSILSWVAFSNQAASSFTGNLSWIKNAAAGGQFYPAGFSNEVSVVGSQYHAPISGTRILDLTNGVAVLSGGNLNEALTNSVTLSSGNLITVDPPGSNQLTLTVDTLYGKINGNFLHPQTQSVRPIKAIVLQQQNMVRGFLLGTNQTGSVTLDPQ
jgi:hypothetical protein